MSSTNDVTFVLVPGAFHRHVYMNGIMECLHRRGHKSITVALPTLGGNGSHSSFLPDVNEVYAAIKTVVVDRNSDAVVVAHSYGGAPATEAVGRLAVELQNTEHPHGNLRLVFVAAYVPLEGQSVSTIGVESYEGLAPPPMPMNVEFTETHCSVSASGEAHFYNNLPQATASSLKEILEPHALGAFLSPITRVGWLSFPSSYVLTLEDGALSIELQEFMVERAKKEIKSKGSSVCSFFGRLGTIKLQTGHFGPYYTKETELADYLEELAQHI